MQTIVKKSIKSPPSVTHPNDPFDFYYNRQQNYSPEFIAFSKIR